MSNVYKRLQTCRVELKKLPIKESGENKFAGYKYMELGDFLPHIVDLCDSHGLCTVISFQENATLTVINSDKPEEQIVFTSPMSTAELKGCHPIQNLGAVETYLRRYLYVAAFDIVEHDALDSTHGKDPVKAETKTETKTEKTARATDSQGANLQKMLLEWCGGDEEQAKYNLKMASSFVPKDKTEPVSLDWDKLDTSSAKWVTGVITKLAEKIGKGEPPLETDDIPF